MTNSIIEDSIKEILKCIDPEHDREGLRDTPKRVRKSYEKIFGGYKLDPKKVLERRFMSEGYDEMVIVKDIQFYSNCEHHMLPFFGKIHVGYIPNPDKDGKIIGLSKIPRVVEIYARRLQNQERLTKQIADCIQDEIETKGVAVICEGQHFCMMSRGVEQQEASMITSQLTGVFKDQIETRQEFMRLIK